MSIQKQFDIRGLTALLVEDTWIVGHSVQAALENMGVLISEPVATVREARALLTDMTFDVAIVDLNLRGESASELIDDLHARGIPIVIVSGNNVPEAIARHALAVLPKPLAFNALLAVLRNVTQEAITA